MATHFAKWWKTKKTMTVLGSNLSDGRRSDTEDLVRDDDASSSSYNDHEAHINPCLLISPSCSENEEVEENLDDCEEKHEIKFQDFECDLQVEGNDSGEEKKEFSFTFYDLDGYGKITKDDVAGLVRSIYGAVNDSIKVPQGGKKTIKVKLTVTPEKYSSNDPQNNAQEENIINNNNKNNLPTSQMGNGCSASPAEGHPTTTPTTNFRNNVNVTIQENLHRERSGRKEKDFKDRFCHFERPKFSSVRLPNSAGCRGCRNFSPEVFRDCSASPLRHRKKWREQRTCSFYRPELIDIIQANMEKNNVSPCCRHELHTHHQHSQSHYTHNNQLNDPSSLFRNENFWKQKLADLTQNNGGGCNHHHHPVSLGMKTHDCHNHKITSHGNHWWCKKHGHHRSRSHDISHDLSQNVSKMSGLQPTDRDQLQSPPLGHVTNRECCNSPSNNNNTINNNCQLNNIINQEEQCVDNLELQHQQGCILTSKQHLSPPRNNKNTNITNSASPHQMKHRNREVEHERAMAQVISWLERENIGDKTKCFSPKKKIHNPNNPCVHSPPVVKKHEHHHVHEHIHHHYYHHYAKETPIIV